MASTSKPEGESGGSTGSSRQGAEPKWDAKTAVEALRRNSPWLSEAVAARRASRPPAPPPGPPPPRPAAVDRGELPIDTGGRAYAGVPEQLSAAATRDAWDAAEKAALRCLEENDAEPASREQLKEAWRGLTRGPPDPVTAARLTPLPLLRHVGFRAMLPEHLRAHALENWGKAVASSPGESMPPTADSWEQTWNAATARWRLPPNFWWLCVSFLEAAGYAGPNDLEGLSKGEAESLAAGLPPLRRAAVLRAWRARNLDDAQEACRHRPVTALLPLTTLPRAPQGAGTQPNDPGYSSSSSQDLAGLPSAWDVADVVARLPEFTREVEAEGGRLRVPTMMTAPGPRSMIKQVRAAIDWTGERSRVMDHLSRVGQMNILANVEGSYQSTASGLRAWASFCDDLARHDSHFDVSPELLL